MKIILIIVAIIIILLLSCSNKEQFTNELNQNILRVKTLNDIVIKEYNIKSPYNINGNELLNLFNNNDIIRIDIPFNYSINIKYSFNVNPNIIGKTIELTNGVYDINKYTSDKTISEIEIKNTINYDNQLLALSNVFIPKNYSPDLSKLFRPENYV